MGRQPHDAVKNHGPHGPRSPGTELLPHGAKAMNATRLVVIEDSSSIALPDELAEHWRGCGGNQAHTAAAVKLHVRWDLKRGRLWGPALTAGRASDHSSPWAGEALPPKSLYCSDLGYFHLGRLAQRHQAKVYSASALASGDSSLQCAGQAAEPEPGLTAAGGTDERDARAGRSQPAAAHALVDAARAQGDWRQAARRSAGRCATSRTTRLGGDVTFGRLDLTDHRCASQALAL